MTRLLAGLGGIALLFAAAACDRESGAGGSAMEPERGGLRGTATVSAVPAPDRQLVIGYFDALNSGNQQDAASLWCNEQKASAFRLRISDFGKFQTNIADPLADIGEAGKGNWSVSLQLLDASNATLADGTAYITLASPDDVRTWCIRDIGLQPPPEPQ